MQIIDVHTHAFPDFLAKKAIDKLSLLSNEYPPLTDGTLRGLLEAMDQSGVDQAVIANIATRPEQFEPILNWSLEIQSERIIPFGSVHPRSLRGTEEVAILREKGFKGIKLHPMYQNFTVDDPEVYPLYDAIRSNNLVLLLHAGYDGGFQDDECANPQRINRVLKDFPGIRLVAAHVGGWRDWPRVLEFLAGRDVYLETSFIHEVPPGLLQQIIHKHDPDKLLFGSDTPWQSQQVQIDFIRQLNMSDALKEKIFSSNARRLLGIFS